MSENPGFQNANYTNFPYSDLTPWSQGEAVVELQELLNAHGFNLRVDGDFGHITEAAVRAYQHQQRLRPDGVVNRKTWLSLKSTIQPGTRLLKQGDSGGDVYELQGLLRVNGHDLCRSGIFDQATTQAVSEFQNRHKLNVTGTADRTTWMLLRGIVSLPTPPQQRGWLPNLRRWW